MKLVHFSEDVKELVSNQKKLGKIIGFVPTMGALHKGHLSLVSKAKEECDFVVVSIYVNPTQFNETSDLNKYPRTLKRDMDLLKGVCDLVFNPNDNKEVYGEEIVLKEYDFGGLDGVLEGAFRPGHFKGMANVVSRLFSVVNPHKAYFGLKDYQQYLLVKKMVKIEGYNIDIVGCNIIRESNGLAMSSRNERLTEKGKNAAGVIYYALNYCVKYAEFIDSRNIQEKAKNMIEGIVEVEYLDFRDAESLNPIKEFEDGQGIFLSFAGYLEGVRLIDNVRFEVSTKTT